MRTDRHAIAFDREAWARRTNEIRARIPVSKVVGRVVELKAKGREHTGLCPFHNERTPSFTVNDGKGFYHCFGCGAHGSAIDFVMQRQGLEFKAAVELLESENGLGALQRARPAPAPPKAAQREDLDKAAAVQRIWRNTDEVRPGSAVDLYLRGRLLVPPAEYGIGGEVGPAGWPVDLRYCGDLWHSDERRGFPGLVTAMRRGGEVVAVHRTYLQATGLGVSKAPIGKPKTMFGDVRGSFIRLGPDADRMLGGEGIETTLSAMQLFGRSGIAFGARAGMATVEPPFACSDFLYAADRNKAHPDPSRSRVGEAAAWKGARAFGRPMGRKVAVKIPDLPAGVETGDFNDMLKLRAAAREVA